MVIYIISDTQVRIRGLFILQMQFKDAAVCFAMAVNSCVVEISAAWFYKYLIWIIPAYM